jgi:hypothetical protein
VATSGRSPPLRAAENHVVGLDTVVYESATSRPSRTLPHLCSASAASAPETSRSSMRFVLVATPCVSRVASVLLPGPVGGNPVAIPLLTPCHHTAPRRVGLWGTIEVPGSNPSAPTQGGPANARLPEVRLERWSVRWQPGGNLFRKGKSAHGKSKKSAIECRDSLSVISVFYLVSCNDGRFAVNV